jgi:hypothetical protein
MIEAMACGTHSLHSGQSSASEMIDQGATGAV